MNNHRQRIRRLWNHWFWSLLLSLTANTVIAQEPVLYAQVSRGIVPQTQNRNGWLTRHSVFSYEGVNYTANLAVNSETYNSLDNAMQRQPRPTNLPARIKLITNSVPALQPLANALRQAAPLTKPETLAAFALAFTQALPYKSDALTTPFDEAWRMPLQTLVDQEIDCEDSAILYVSLLSALGLDSGLILVPGHMLAGVAGNFTGDYLKFQGKSYYLAETTGLNWRIGQVPPEYKGTKAELLPVAASAYAQIPQVQTLPGLPSSPPITLLPPPAPSPPVKPPSVAPSPSRPDQPSSSGISLGPLLLILGITTAGLLLWWQQHRHVKSPTRPDDYDTIDLSHYSGGSDRDSPEMNLEDDHSKHNNPWND
jgi:hypothetical protein